MNEPVAGKSTRSLGHLTNEVQALTVNRMVKFVTLDRTFSALSDATRRDILERLARGPASISELARPYGISLPGVMKHVRILEDANLVTTEKMGRTRHCRLGPDRMKEASQWIQRYRRHWERRLDRLEAYVERKKGGAT
jgi:DNA-binding transcriptional ArsR family regulator